MSQSEKKTTGITAKMEQKEQEKPKLTSAEMGALSRYYVANTPKWEFTSQLPFQTILIQ